jgi:hypothetical protein
MTTTTTAAIPIAPTLELTLEMLEAVDKEAYQELFEAIKQGAGAHIAMAIRKLMIALRMENFQPFERLFRKIQASVLLCARNLPANAPAPATLRRGATRYEALSSTLQKKTYIIFVAVNSFPIHLFEESETYEENFAKLADTGFYVVR